MGSLFSLCELTNKHQVSHVLIQRERKLDSRMRAYYPHTTCTSEQGYKQRRGFIIAQAPMKSTCRDFWKMVNERECGVIVMLSDLVENGEVGRTEI